MFYVKAGRQVKLVFEKLLKATGENVEWTSGVLAVNLNTLILPGLVRSLFFDIEGRRVFSEIIELNFDPLKVEQMPEESTVINVFNMLVYAFGRWGALKGLKVEKDDDTLMRLFREILKPLDINVEFHRFGMDFMEKNGVILSYEDVIERAIENANKEAEEELAADEGEEGLGLWRNFKWHKNSYGLNKDESETSDPMQHRLGHNFYGLRYKCPVCSERLYMCVYPPGREQKVETTYRPMYMARVVTCPKCNRFLTPQPDMLLQEGKIYELEFDDDKNAYEDYRQLLGEHAQRVSNCNFNKYESEYDKKSAATKPKSIGEAARHMDTMSLDELIQLRDMIDSGFFLAGDIADYYNKITNLIEQRRNERDNPPPQIEVPSAQPRSDDNISQGSEDAAAKSSASNLNTPGAPKKPLPIKTSSGKVVSAPSGSVKMKGAPHSKSENVSTKSGTIRYAGDTAPEATANINDDNIEDDTLYDEDGQVVIKREGIEYFDDKEFEDNINSIDGRKYLLEGLFTKGKKNKAIDSGRLKRLRKSLRDNDSIDPQPKDAFRRLNEKIFKEQHPKLYSQVKKIIEGDSYKDMASILDEVRKTDGDSEAKGTIEQDIIEPMSELGNKEIQKLLEKYPKEPTREQYKTFKKKIGTYKDIDTSKHQDYIKKLRDPVEKKEVSTFVNDAVRKSSDDDMHKVYNKLLLADYEPENKKIFIDSLHRKIATRDMQKVDRMTHNLDNLDIDDTAKLYSRVNNEELLPDIKSKTLEEIKKRLKKLKSQECALLAEKLRKDMSRAGVDISNFHFFDPKSKDEILTKQVDNFTYERGEFEYPIASIDASKKGNGKDGFVITEDNIYAKNMMSVLKCSIPSIRKVNAQTGLLNKGVYLHKKNGAKEKISTPSKGSDMKTLAAALGDYIKYLQEKPRSRELAYMAKEQHKIICCYRCGFYYEGADACPRCGSRQNA